MKKTISILVIFLVLVSCKEEIIQKPDHLIAKDAMVNVMYDLSILEALKYQNQSTLDADKIDPRAYIFEKYKIDSLRFAQSNKYYASNYAEYKDMYDQIGKRLEQNKAVVDLQIRATNKKKKKATLDKIPVKIPTKAVDSLKNKKPEQLEFKDLKWPLYTDEYLKILYLKRF